MTEPKVMLFEEGTDQQMGIRCRLISEWYKIDYFVSTRIGLLLEIKKHNPVIVFLDSDLYAKIDGIETAHMIRYKYGIPVMYIW
jgi:hypothetical protein